MVSDDNHTTPANEVPSVLTGPGPAPDEPGIEVDNDHVDGVPAQDIAASGIALINTNIAPYNFNNNNNNESGSSTINFDTMSSGRPQSYTLLDQLRIQEDGRIIVSTELKASMDELAEEFWKQVGKRFPITTAGQEQIDKLVEGMQAAVDACESCENASCSACEILRTSMNGHVAPQIDEEEETKQYGITWSHDGGGGDITIAADGNTGLATTHIAKVELAETVMDGAVVQPNADELVIKKENDNERPISAEPNAEGERDEGQKTDAAPGSEKACVNS